MSLGLVKMWLSFVAMGFMIVASLLILLSRTKLKGIFRGIVSFIATCLFIFGGLLMVLVISSGPGT
ncbi:DUF2768 domain-containing protein [Pullulanibacillus sp. KACC 23026]|uniref:DUF2768 domain-containing protein n=1 Tax=Pullulanibacillus sp. KACC 23026 TaxID=3028315 RepID=UPI0023AFCCEF|nr:DUF2768 domain-containing protein [Pullulanibacillus sp. KACC 23026]WEG11382.1 DUF2768 domain-containing protein [Pullulanibacillus sp. KACC 23026]